MRKILTVVTLLLLSFQCQAADFRSADFGMSLDMVRATEPNVDWMDTGDDTIAFMGSVNSLDAIVGFMFTNGVFSRGGYIFQENHTNDTEYIRDYEDLSELLEKKYGDPDKEQVVWLDDLYRDDPADWGMAVSVGHLKYYKRWETETAKIQIALNGDNFKISMRLFYDSKALSTQLQESKEKAVLDDL